MIPLTATHTDRAAGVMLGTACGDALGAGYEFGPPLDASTPVGMVGGGSFNWAPGEWTDDTSMAIVLLQEFAIDDDTVLDRVTARWADWASTAPDVGIQTRSILGSAASYSAADVATAAQQHLARTGRAGGNGSLMRTAPLALFYLDDAAGLADMARTVSDLTHPDPDAGDACVLWSLAIRHAVSPARSTCAASSPRSRHRDARCGHADWMTPSDCSPPTSIRTAGWCRRCREPGRPSTMAAGWSTRWSVRCAAVATPTRSRPSREGCSGRSGARRRFRRSGAASCTGGRGCVQTISCGSR